ncbi:cupin domain-containing protein [Yunchengibacter salinarum]|uniref:cupin domain-containing protein n=1 Tax=Yunchengibacter salinarum TaxID=3133399 RepID=UPI0035B5770C
MSDGPAGRGHMSAIHYLLRRGETARWHRIDAVELWLFHGGCPLVLETAHGDETTQRAILGLDLASGHRPQAAIAAGVWQRAWLLPEGRGDWSLMSCTVAPGFTFDHWELAGPDNA